MITIQSGSAQNGRSDRARQVMCINLYRLGWLYGRKVSICLNNTRKSSNFELYRNEHVEEDVQVNAETRASR